MSNTIPAVRRVGHMVYINGAVYNASYAGNSCALSGIPEDMRPSSGGHTQPVIAAIKLGGGSLGAYVSGDKVMIGFPADGEIHFSGSWFVE